MNELHGETIERQDEKFYLGSDPCRDDLPSHEFAAHVLMDLHRQSLERVKSKYPNGYESHPFSFVGADAFFSISMFGQKMENFFRFAGREILLRVIKGECTHDQFESTQRKLLEIYENCFNQDQIKIQPAILLGMLDVYNFILNPDEEQEQESSKASQENRNDSAAEESLSIIEDVQIEARRDVVYFVQNPSSRKIKIGFSCNFKQRMKALECGAGEALEVLLLIDGGYDLERDLHLKFSNHRIKGEWFHPTQEIIDYISKLKTKAA